MLYPQNDDRIVAIDSVTSLHPMYYRGGGGGRDAALATTVDCYRGWRAVRRSFIRTSTASFAVRRWSSSSRLLQQQGDVASPASSSSSSRRVVLRDVITDRANAGYWLRRPASLDPPPLSCRTPPRPPRHRHGGVESTESRSNIRVVVALSRCYFRHAAPHARHLSLLAHLPPDTIPARELPPRTSAHGRITLTRT